MNVSGQGKPGDGTGGSLMLLVQHRRYLCDRAITDAVAMERGY
jgi:hypothetical protein